MNLKNYSEEQKYRKKTESNTSKSSKKSKHKHQYIGCIIKYPFMYKNEKHYSVFPASYCSICGKIGDNILNIPVTEKLEDDCRRMYETEEILEMNKDLEVFEVENITQKYVSIVKE